VSGGSVSPERAVGSRPDSGSPVLGTDRAVCISLYGLYLHFVVLYTAIVVTAVEVMR
jgi:hypothetical protein